MVRTWCVATRSPFLVPRARMSNDIFVIANMAAGPDSSRAADKTDEGRVAPARVAVRWKRSHLRYESDQVIHAVMLSHASRLQAVLREVWALAFASTPYGYHERQSARRVRERLRLSGSVKPLPLPIELSIDCARSSCISTAHVSPIVPGCQLTDERHDLLGETLHIRFKRLELQHEQFDSRPMKLDNTPRYRFVAANQSCGGSTIRPNPR